MKDKIKEALLIIVLFIISYADAILLGLLFSYIFVRKLIYQPIMVMCILHTILIALTIFGIKYIDKNNIWRE